MADDPEHPLMRIAVKELLDTVIKFVFNKPVTQSTIDVVKDICSAHRTKWRAAGVNFPALRLIVIPRLKAYKLWNAEWNIDSVRLSVVKLVREFPDITPQEVAQALIWAYPQIKLRDIMIPRSSGRGEVPLGE